MLSTTNLTSRCRSASSISGVARSNRSAVASALRIGMAIGMTPRCTVPSCSRKREGHALYEQRAAQCRGCVPSGACR
jgi:hypothetical protein